MKVSLNLLKKFIPLDETPDAIAQALTLLGLEVDGIDYIGKGLEQIVPVVIQTIEKHPTHDKVQILTVSSKKKKHTLVCADLNAFEGQVTALAPLGSTITPQAASPVKITKRSFGKIESHGMLCSEKDLGLSQDNSGIINLEKNALDLASIQSIYEDVIFDLSLTPNLGHCRSVLGTARELSAHYNLELKIPDFSLQEDTHTNSQNLLHIQNNYPQACPQYNVRIIKNVDIQPSNPHLKRSIEKLGYQSVNNVVDCLNFTMHMFGQPLHGFDLDQLEGSELRVEKAKGKEVLAALNHKDYTLESDAIIIADKTKPVCIAGIIGDEKTSIKHNTKNIAIEAAQFCHQNIRKTAKSIGFRSDSSNRFENQIDPMGLKQALDYACALIQKECSGIICKGIIDKSQISYHPRSVSVRMKKIQSIIGINLSISEVEGFFNQLSMPFKLQDETFHVKIPSYRNDLKHEIDLVEEILRIYGYNNIKKTPLKCTLSNHEHHGLYTFKRALGEILENMGLQEFVSCNLISNKEAQFESKGFFEHQELIKVLHAKSQDQSILRPSLLSGFLNAARINQRQKNNNIRAFEIGHTYLKNKSKIDETLSLAILLGGNKTDPYYLDQDKKVNFFTLKGILLEMFTRLNIADITFKKSKANLFHPHQQAQIFYNKQAIGAIGSIHPSLLEDFDCSKPLFFAQIDTKNLVQPSKKIIKFTPLAQFPSSTRDLTLTVSKAVALSRFDEELKNINCPILCNFELINIFEPKDCIDEHNITFRFTYRDETKTLLDQQVQDAHNKISEAFHKI